MCAWLGAGEDAGADARPRRAPRGAGQNCEQRETDLGGRGVPCGVCRGVPKLLLAVGRPASAWQDRRQDGALAGSAVKAMLTDTRCDAREVVGVRAHLSPLQMQR